MLYQLLKAPLLSANTEPLTQLADAIQTHSASSKLLQHALVDAPPVLIRDGGVIAAGFSSELDKLRELSQQSNDYLIQLEQREREKTGISTLKVGYNRVHGYYIEISKAQSADAPPNYTRRQTLKNAERFITEELKTYEDQVLGSKERALALEQQLYQQLISDIAAEHDSLKQTVNALARLDTLCCLAERADSLDLCAPQLTQDPGLHIQAGRHPVVEQVLDSPFTPNDCLLDPERRMAVDYRAQYGWKIDLYATDGLNCIACSCWQLCACSACQHWCY